MDSDDEQQYPTTCKALLAQKDSNILHLNLRVKGLEIEPAKQSKPAKPRQIVLRQLDCEADTTAFNPIQNTVERDAFELVHLRPS